MRIFLKKTRPLLLLFLLLAGCGEKGPQFAPVEGRVLYNGKPLEFGGVMFQPASGQPARAVIQPDGSFVLSTNSTADGAVVGTNRVRITCFEGQDPKRQGAGGGEVALGRALIPKRYTDYNRGGLTAEVKSEGNEPFVFKLED